MNDAADYAPVIDTGLGPAYRLAKAAAASDIAYC